jgi:hypothetical protein
MLVASLASISYDLDRRMHGRRHDRSVSKQKRDLILHQPERAIAEAHGMTVAQVQAIPRDHPIEQDREKFIRNALKCSLLMLDTIEAAFLQKAVRDQDASAAMVLCKVQARWAGLLGLDAPVGHTVQIIPPAPTETSTD